MFVHLLGHTGGYSREEAIAAIDQEGTLPDMLDLQPGRSLRSTRTAGCSPTT